MEVSAVAYEWFIRAVSMRRRSGPPVPLKLVPWTAKFLLLSSGNTLTVVVGPLFVWPSEYHHNALLNAFTKDKGDGYVQHGSGVLSAEHDDDGNPVVCLIFWRNCPCGTYAGQLGDDELAKLGALLGCRVAILDDSPPPRPGWAKR